MTTKWAVVASIMALTCAATPVLAQSWRHPPKVDYDQEAEEYSEFWEEARSANTQSYRGRIALALELWAQGGDDERRRALAELELARKAFPKQPDAYYWLGELRFENKEWVACAGALTSLFTLEVGYQPKSARDGRSPDHTLARCLLYAGNFEDAAEQLKRIKTLRYGTPELELQLGEALMALGRLDDAIEILREAQSRTSRSEARFALAVALDRAERLAESSEVMADAVLRDPALASLLSVDKLYAPSEEEHYYLGLARKAAGHKSHSLFHFRRYLLEAPDSPWRRRVQSHLTALEPIELGEDVTIMGSANWKKQDLSRAIGAQKSRLLECVRDEKHLLLQVAISAVRRQTVGDGSGVRVTVLAQSGVEPERLRRAIECSEEAARRIKAPALAGPSGSYAHAEFPLIFGQR